MSRRGSALICLLALCACVGPRQVTPPAAKVVAPADWRWRAGPSAPLEALWWKAFSDPTLDGLVEQALANNPDIGQAAARVAQARAQARLARAQRGPEINFQGIGGYTRVLEVTGPITTWGAEPQATVGFDLDLFGRLASASAAARANLLAGEAARDAVSLAVASTTAIAYIQLLGFDERLRVARETLASRRAALTVAQRRAEFGYTSDLEVRQAEAEYRATAQLVPSIELAIGQQEDALATLVGDPALILARAPRALDRLNTPAIPAGLPSELLRRRPDIVSAEDNLVATDHTLDSARAAMLPSLSLTGSVGAIIASVLPNPQSIFLIGGSILAPLFDSGRRRAAADTAAGRRDEAAFAYRKTALQAFREVNDGLVAADKLASQLIELRAQLDAQAGLLKVASDRYRAGYASYLEQVDAERLLLAGQLSLAQVRTQQLVSLVTLYEAMGGGWNVFRAGAPGRHGDR